MTYAFFLLRVEHTKNNVDKSKNNSSRINVFSRNEIKLSR